MSGLLHGAGAAALRLLKVRECGLELRIVALVHQSARSCAALVFMAPKDGRRQLWRRSESRLRHPRALHSRHESLQGDKKTQGGCFIPTTSPSKSVTAFASCVTWRFSSTVPARLQPVTAEWLRCLV